MILFTEAQVIRLALLRDHIGRLPRRWNFEAVHFVRDCECKGVPRDTAIKALGQIVDQWSSTKNPWEFAERWLHDEHGLSVKLSRPLFLAYGGPRSKSEMENQKRILRERFPEKEMRV
jgi:hypothetical protein